ncbi:tRNA dihydrouridine synthase DusB [Oscillospiraceae bacterium NSJ-54]|uniref:tRNA-dihydrouridine synthase n=2 Tax=Zongyangia hominis TaxID=2763677 RepID=A0A926IBF3_9FIRM|nr:tRNA dihydrouridine synthase DusB [Zongyangia hominis]
MMIGNVRIPRTATLAPMAGVGDRAFRQVCKEFGCAFVVGEMASSKGLTYSDKKTAALLTVTDAERPMAVQLFGDEPATLAEAARRAMAFSPDVIDINMGCPAPKVAGNGGGSALMKHPKLAGEIVAAVVKAVPVPVTAKFRKGWDEEHVNAVEFAKILEDAGAAALTVHGRTRQQMYAPPVDRDIIRQVKAAVSIPVIGNGDVTDALSAKRMLEETGCDCVAVGRGALGRPWVFEQIAAYLTEGVLLPDPPLKERMEVMLRQIRLACEYKGEYIAMREARRHAAYYMHGLRGAASLRRAAGQLREFADAQRLAEEALRQNEG